MITDLKGCNKCGAYFRPLRGEKYCPSCTEQLEDIFHDVKDYIYEHPRCSMMEVATEFNITVGIVKQWVKEERLSFAEDSQVKLTCESCGAAISTGKFCKDCKTKLVSGFNKFTKPTQDAPTKPKPEKTGPKIRSTRF